MEYRLYFCGSQRQGGAAKLNRHGPQRGLANIDHSGQYHQRQHQPGGNKIGSADKLMSLGAFENDQLQLIHQRV